MINIIGFYKDWRLVESGGYYYVVDKKKQAVIYKSKDEESATKAFIMLCVGFVNEKIEIGA